MSPKIKCSDVRYRQGFVEVTNVHAGCINLEIWNVHPDMDLLDASLESLRDVAVVGNTEIELNVAQTIRLIEALQAAIKQARSESGG